MKATSLHHREITLPDLALHYGPIELQRPLTKAEFVALTEGYPDLGMEREKDGTTMARSNRLTLPGFLRNVLLRERKRNLCKWSPILW